MEIQTLNMTQQERLLNLCEEFFPEYDVRISKPLFNYPSDYYIQLGLKDSKKYDYNIHWYQLCLTELPKRICRNLWTEEDKDKWCTTLAHNEIEGSNLNS